MDPNSSRKSELITLLIRSAIAGFISYHGIKLATNLMDPTVSQKRKAKSKAMEILENLGISDKGDDLNEHELIIAGDLLNPKEIDVGFRDIAGLDSIIEELNLQVILPLTFPELFESNLRQPPRGVLFHGPPGCGKTMLAKAIAKEANIRFINLSVSALTDKWYGESQKLAQAVFTLALKIQPCIIFIDEIDSFLRSRDSQDHEATAMMKAQFMTLWEGILSSKKCQIVLIGATNRPQDVDNAVLRRMPCMFQIDLPKENERHEILKLILKDEKLSSDVDLGEIARQTEDYSGSDLKDLCRRSAMKGLKELNQFLLKSNRDQSSSSSSSSSSLSSPVKDNQMLQLNENHHPSNQPDPLPSSSSSPFNLPPPPSSNDISSTRRLFSRVKSSSSRISEPRDITMDDFLHSIESIDASRNGVKPRKSRIPLD